MNKVILIGRLTREPDVRYTQGQDHMAIARYTLAVDRRQKREGEQNADFISCVAFGKGGEFAEKYLRQGMKICVIGRIQTGSYTNREGRKVYTTDVIVEDHEFVESKSSQPNNSQPNNSQSEEERRHPKAGDDDFLSIPDGLDEELPFL